MIKPKTSLIALATTLIIGSGDVACANLISNGGFETGDLSGWTVSGNTTYTFVPLSPFPGYAPYSGSYFALLGAIGSLGFLSQTFTDTATAGYAISLWFASDGLTPNEFDVEWNGTVLYDQADLAAFPYTELSFNVTGTGSDTLTISGRDDANFLSLDDVSVNPVPEPASLPLLGTALLGLAAIGCRRKPV